ncbi:MAG: DUF1801 domain-containing protein [Myxococcales bacterium]|nr:DUF1801 domain-containing protein [Myxococcales bacterium]
MSAPKKAAPKKVATKKVATKKVATKKAATKKAATKKAATKKAATKKAATKKAATKKAATKKAATKKAATQKAATQKAAASATGSAALDTYIAEHPPEVAAKLREVREIVRRVAPHAAEKIGYGIPTFTVDGKNVFHFAAFRHHLGLYPGPEAIAAHTAALAAYETSKGAIRVPFDRPVPTALIETLVRFHVG